MVVVTYKAIVKNENGLHAANSARLVRSLSKFNGEFQLIHDGNTYDMKSILGLMSLALHEKKSVELRIALYHDINVNAVESDLSEHFELSDRTELKL